VIAVYEKARKWIAANPEETAKIIAEEAKIPLAVAKLQLTRNDFTQSRPGPAQAQALKGAGSILLQEDLVKKGTDVSKVVDELLDDKPARNAARAAEQVAEAGGTQARLALGW
jgi:sulfonate transport system substrate-binding protein